MAWEGITEVPFQPPPLELLIWRKGLHFFPSSSNMGNFSRFEILCSWEYKFILCHQPVEILTSRIPSTNKSSLHHDVKDIFQINGRHGHKQHYLIFTMGKAEVDILFTYNRVSVKISVLEKLKISAVIWPVNS